MQDNAIDENTFKSIQELMGDNFSVMIEKYKESTAEYFVEMDAGMSENDAQRVQNAAHPFKSSSASLGFMAVSEIAKQVEKQAEEAAQTGGAVDAVQGDVAQLKEAYANVISYLETLNL